MTRLLPILLVLIIVIIVLRASKVPEQRALKPGTPRMTRKEACEVLGVGPEASRDEIAKAYKSLIRKVHPDAGGSTYLTTKLNEARRILLE